MGDEPRRGGPILAAVVFALTLTGCAAPTAEDPYELLRVIAVEGRQGVATDGERYYVSGSTALYVYRYDLESGEYVGRLHLRAVPQWQQGIAAYRGALFLTADDGDAEEEEWDNLWRVVPRDGESAAFVTHVRTFDDFRFPGEIEGLDFDEKAGELVVLANRGKRIVLGMPKGLYPGYESEIHELYVYAVPAP